MAAQRQAKPITLTQTAATLRTFINVGVVALIVMIVGRVFFQSLVAYYQSLQAEKIVPPNVAFQIMPRINFPSQSDTPASYKLETIGNQLPSFGDQGKVFFMPSAQPSLTAVDRAKRRASNMGFIFEPEILDSRHYRWTKTDNVSSVLDMDILTGTFTIKSDWASRPELLAENAALDNRSLVTKVQQVVSQAESLSEDVADGTPETQFVKAIGGQVVPADSLSDADFLQVDLYRTKIDELYGSVNSEGKRGPVRALISPDGTILEMSMELLPIEYDIVGTYPLLPTSAAWQLLANNQGYIANPGELDEAVVRNVTLAYYEPNEEFPYYRPVYVFEGDKGFIGYVEAVDPVWLTADTSQ